MTQTHTSLCVECSSSSAALFVAASRPAPLLLFPHSNMTMPLLQRQCIYQICWKVGTFRCHMGNLQSAETTLKGVKDVLSSVISSPFHDIAAPTSVQNVNDNAAVHNCPVRVSKRQRYAVNGDGSFASNDNLLHARTTSSSSSSDHASAKKASTLSKNAIKKSNFTAFGSWSPSAGKKAPVTVVGAAVVAKHMPSNPSSADGCSDEFPSSADGCSAQVVVTISCHPPLLSSCYSQLSYIIQCYLTQICAGLGFGCHCKIGNFKKGHIFDDCHTVINANNINNTTMKLF